MAIPDGLEIGVDRIKTWPRCVCIAAGMADRKMRSRSMPSPEALPQARDICMDKNAHGLRV